MMTCFLGLPAQQLSELSNYIPVLHSHFLILTSSLLNCIQQYCECIVALLKIFNLIGW